MDHSIRQLSEQEKLEVQFRQAVAAHNAHARGIVAVKLPNGPITGALSAIAARYDTSDDEIRRQLGHGLIPHNTDERGHYLHLDAS